jgi:hypothetical protein
LLGESSIPSHVVWNLINGVATLTVNGGWKEFIAMEEVSLWTSAYVFRFLSYLKYEGRDEAVLGDVESFLEKSAPLIQQTEEYLEFQWRKDRWAYSTSQWEVNAPIVLIECLPFIQNEGLIDEVYESLSRLLSPTGRLIDPNVGISNQASEYILSTRIAYALKLSNSRRDRSDPRLEKLIDWLLDNYSEEHLFSTCDIYFLLELVLSRQA